MQSYVYIVGSITTSQAHMYPQYLNPLLQKINFEKGSDLQRGYGSEYALSLVSSLLLAMLECTSQHSLGHVLPCLYLLSGSSTR